MENVQTPVAGWKPALRNAVIFLHSSSFHFQKALEQFDPPCHAVQHFAPDFRICTSGAGRHVEGMIGIGKQFEGCPGPQLLDEWLEKVEICKLVTTTLQEEHLNLNLEKVLGALSRGPPWRMQWESQENQASDSWQRCGRLRLRSHAATEGFAAGEEGKPGGQA
jgi:hypothetical protein